MTTWSEFKKNKKYPKLERDITADVAIIGGGLAGLLCAHELAKAGKKVVLLEKGEISSDVTSATTAFITKVIDTELAELISIWGEDAARIVFESGQAAVEEFDAIIKKERIDCEFARCDNFIFASDEKQYDVIKAEAKAYERLAIPATLGRDIDLPFSNYGYLRIPLQAKFHITKFTYRLAEILADSGVEIYEQTPVQELEEEADENKPRTLRTPSGQVVAENVVIATYQPLTNKKTHLKKGMYVSYILEADIPKDLFPEGIYENCDNPYYYFRIDRKEKNDRIIIGGEDHRAELESEMLSKKSFHSLQAYLEKVMEGRPYTITKKWSGPILEPSDGLALIGEIMPHVFVATAFSGNGMTYSMISALLLCDLVLRKKNSWAEVYDPKRSLLHPKRLAVKAADYTEEFFRGAVKNLLSS